MFIGSEIDRFFMRFQDHINDELDEIVNNVIYKGEDKESNVQILREDIRGLLLNLHDATREFEDTIEDEINMLDERIEDEIAYNEEEV